MTMTKRPVPIGRRLPECQVDCQQSISISSKYRKWRESRCITLAYSPSKRLFPTVWLACEMLEKRVGRCNDPSKGGFQSLSGGQRAPEYRSGGLTLWARTERASQTLGNILFERERKAKTLGDKDQSFAVRSNMYELPLRWVSTLGHLRY